MAEMLRHFCRVHPDEQLVPVYGNLGGEPVVDVYGCAKCSMGKKIRIPMRYIVKGEAMEEVQSVVDRLCDRCNKSLSEHAEAEEGYARPGLSGDCPTFTDTIHREAAARLTKDLGQKGPAGYVR